MHEPRNPIGAQGLLGVGEQQRGLNLEKRGERRQDAEIGPCRVLRRQLELTAAVLMAGADRERVEDHVPLGPGALDDVDLFEINEAFAPVVLAWHKELGVPLEKTNVNGGAIALGHPLGATGARVMTTLLHELERSGGRYGLQTMCEGGGQANATIIERL